MAFASEPFGPGRQVVCEIGAMQTWVLRVELEPTDLDLDQAHTQPHAVQRKACHWCPPKEVVGNESGE
jgi:hypothetical protein